MVYLLPVFLRGYISLEGQHWRWGVTEEDTASPGFRWLRFQLGRGFVAWDMKPDSKAVGK